MVNYCRQCKGFHEEGEFCPKYKEQLKQHPEWFNEMVQTITTSTIAFPTVQRYGSAIKEYLVAYSGIDNETGQQLTRSLKSISQQKINPDYKYQNTRQQAGFAAEIQETARENAERAINGDTNRTVRTDDIGKVNDPLYDLVEIDATGNVISGSGVQMKFVGATAEECWKKVTSPKFQKYVDENVRIAVPSDYYDKMIDAANNQIQSLENQLKTLMDSGNLPKAKLLKSRIEHCKKAKDLLKKSQVSSKEAEYAAQHPKKYTGKEILKNANEAGLEAAKAGAIIGGGISILRNVVQLKNGDFEADVAIKNIAVDTARGAAGGYIVGGGGAALKGVMQNSSSEMARSLSKTTFPSGTIALAYGITRSTITNFMKYKNGAISKNEMEKSISKDAIKGGLVTCSLAVIPFSKTAAGVAATVGVAIYLDAVCTNVLEEVFGEGFYEELLTAEGCVLGATKNFGEMLKEFESNVLETQKNINKSNELLRKFSSEKNALEENEKKLFELSNLMEEL